MLFLEIALKFLSDREGGVLGDLGTTDLSTLFALHRTRKYERIQKRSLISFGPKVSLGRGRAAGGGDKF